MSYQSFSAAVLEINRLACTVAMPEFQAAALDALRQHIDFDTAWWGLASPQADGSTGIHTSLAYRLPADYPATWHALQHDDLLARAVTAVPGQAVSLGAEAISGSARAAQYLQRAQIAHGMCVLAPTANLKQFGFLSLYRSARQPAFTEAAQQLLQQLMPHLEAALGTNWLLHLERIRARQQSAPATTLALVDPHGHIQVAEPRLLELLSQEWPRWQGPDLPGELRRQLAAGSAFRGQTLMVHAYPAGGFWLLDVRPLTEAHCLTPRELEIARQFSVGASHKEIARALAIAPNTVRHHLRAVYRKFDVGDKAQLAAKLAAGAEANPHLAAAAPAYVS